MPRMRSVFPIVSLLMLSLLIAGNFVLSDEVGFSGLVGLGVTFTPIPPLAYNLESGLTLSLNITGFSFGSETVFDLTGFQSQRFDASVDFGAISLSEEILFDPSFSWNQVSVDAQIVGVLIGMDLILADIGSVQTPTYSMGSVLELASEVLDGFAIRSITGFGATDMVNLLGGAEAPFSYEYLYLFSHLDALFHLQTPPQVVIVPGFYFEEELLRLTIDYCGAMASSSTWLSWTGFDKEILELGYRFEEPRIALLTAVAFNSSFAISGLDFLFDLEISDVRFTSKTSFAEPTTPSIIPIVFSGQGFAVSFTLFDVVFTSETSFDGAFLFAEERLGIELTVDPVKFASLTAFDWMGFSGQWIRASVSFSGISLYTEGKFNYTGVVSVTFGFEFRF